MSFAARSYIARRVTLFPFPSMQQKRPYRTTLFMPVWARDPKTQFSRQQVQMRFWLANCFNFNSKNLEDEIAAFFHEACVHKCPLRSERLATLKETILTEGWIQFHHTSRRARQFILRLSAWSSTKRWTSSQIFRPWNDNVRVDNFQCIVSIVQTDRRCGFVFIHPNEGGVNQHPYPLCMELLHQVKRARVQNSALPW